MKFQVSSRSPLVGGTEPEMTFNTVEELVNFCRRHGRCSFTAPGEKLEDQSRRWDGKETLIYFQNEYD